MGSNLSPRGLTIRPTAGTTAPVDEVKIDPDGLGYHDADLVWSWNGTEWVVVWAAEPAEVSSVLLAWATSQVTISWSLPSPEAADTYRVYRPDGSLAGSVSRGATSLVDLSPLPLNGAYVVTTVLGSMESAGVASAALDLTLPASSPASSVSSDGTVSAQVTLSWAFTAGRQPDQWRVYRDGVLKATLAGSVTTWVDTSPSIGNAVDYEIEPWLSSVASAAVVTEAVSVAPCVPTSVTLTAPNPPINTLRLGWSAPAAGAVVEYEVEKFTGGVWVAHETVTPPAALTSDWSTAVAGTMRVRTVAGGGDSSWITLGPVTPVTDVTAPGDGTMSSWQPASSFGRMTAAYVAPSDSDLATIELQYRKNGGAWTTFHGPIAATPGQVFSSVYAATGVAGDVFEVRSKTTDITGNVNTSGTLSSYTLVASPTYFAATDSTFWQNGSNWNISGTYRPAQGYNGDPAAWNVGVWVYGTSPYSTLYNSGRRTIVSGRVFFARSTWGSSSWLAPHCKLHDYTTRPTSGTPVLYETEQTLNGLMRNESVGGGQNEAWSDLPSGWAAMIVAGTHRGIASYAAAGSPWFNYQSAHGPGAENADCGKLEIHHLG